MNRIALDSNTVDFEVNGESIREWLCSRIAAALKIHPAQVDPDIEFDRYGLDSVQAVNVTAELGVVLGTGELPPTLLYDYPTINQLADHVAGTVRKQ